MAQAAIPETMPACIVEFSYYHGMTKGEMIVKELAVIDPETNQVQVFVFKAPYFWSELPKKVQTTNFLKRKYGLHFSWEQGQVPYCEINTILTQITRRYPIVICNGLEKSEFIADCINRGVHDMSKNFVNFVYENEKSARYCMYHNRKTRESCALWQCHVFTNYVNSLMGNVRVDASGLNVDVKDVIPDADDKTDDDFDIVFEQPPITITKKHGEPRQVTFGAACPSIMDSLLSKSMLVYEKDPGAGDYLSASPDTQLTFQQVPCSKVDDDMEVVGDCLRNLHIV